MTDETRVPPDAPPEQNAELVDPKQSDLTAQSDMVEDLPGVTRDYDVLLATGTDPDHAEEETLRRLRDGETT